VERLVLALEVADFQCLEELIDALLGRLGKFL